MSYDPRDVGYPPQLGMSDYFCMTQDEMDGEQVRQERELLARTADSTTNHEVEGNTEPPPCGPTLTRTTRGLRGRFWCWTLNNPTVAETELLSMRCENNDNIRYLTYGREIGEEGTPHYQGYIEYKDTVTLAHLKARFGPRFHWEPRKGTAQQANMYCWKEDCEPYIYGKISKGQGARSDLESVQADCDSGMSLKDIATNHFGTFLRYNRGIAQYLSMTRSLKRRGPPKIQWLWGESGAGKSRLMTEVIEEEPVDEVYFLSTSPTGTWWGGYNGQKIVVMDDFRASWFPHNTILRLLDSVPMSVPFHGGSAPLEAERWIITTNLPPHLVYKEDPAGALVRRVHDFATVYHLVVGKDPVCVGEPNVESSKTELLV